VPQRGRTLGLVSAAWSVALLAATLVVLPLRDLLGDADLWPWVGLVAVPAAATLWVLDGEADRVERLRGRS
jgi:MFS family permease